jgi:murein DD-endopeptidase MepM/ murein hydrolase activator NlpD
VLAVTAGIALGLASAPALAVSGGAGVTPPPKKGVNRPAAPGSAQPQIAEARCTANPGGPCIDVHRVEPGATVSLRGRSLAAVTQIVFYGGRGPSDDAIGAISSARPTGAVAIVPAQARSGPVGVIDRAGRRAPRWDGLIVEGPAAALGLRPASTLGSVQVGLSEPRTIFFAGGQKAVFNFRVTGSAPIDVQVDLVRVTDGTVVRTWTRPRSAPGVTQRIAWNGSVGRRMLPPGRYGFRAATPGALGVRAGGAPADNQDSVALLDNVFPIRGAHTYNLGAGRFGASRRGHRHQGQDVFARCGTPLVAARGGTVTYAGFHALAGYYLVIDGKGTGIDYGYMHLRGPALVSTGDSVYTGQAIGQVGDTGDAVGCHLHFEEWTAPGWYKGGHPFDPLADLKSWDAGP